MRLNRRRLTGEDRRRLGILGIFALFLAVIGTWSLATPLFGAPDEDAHLYRAVSLIHGDLIASRSGVNAPGQTTILVPVPADLNAFARNLDCFRHNSDVPASCMTWSHVPDRSQESLVPSGAARYNPVYYALVGWPAAYSDALEVVWLMRLISIIMCAGLLTTAFISARREGSRYAVIALLVAVTPTTMFLSGSVNPNALEICASAAVWSLLLLAIRQPAWDAPLVLRASIVPVALMVSTRAISPLWLAVIATIVGLAAGFRWIAATLRDRTTQATVAVLTTVTLAGIAWTLWSGVLNIATPYGKPPVQYTTSAALGKATRETWIWARQTVGAFGWNDTMAPGVLVVLLFVAIVVLIAYSGPSRSRAALALSATGVALAVSIMSEVSGINMLGTWWQGRYVLPILIGVPMLAVAGQNDRGTARRFERPVLGFVTATIVTADAASFVLWLHRTMNGIGHPWTLRSAWSPPMAAPLLVIINIAAITALCRSAVPRRADVTYQACRGPS